MVVYYVTFLLIVEKKKKMRFCDLSALRPTPTKSEECEKCMFTALAFLLLFGAQSNVTLIQDTSVSSVGA